MLLNCKPIGTGAELLDPSTISGNHLSQLKISTKNLDF